jgi:hypothetical protein
LSTGRPSRRPSASLVISLVALFIALGSGAYAASKIGSKQLKNKAVTTKKLDNKAVSGKKLEGKAVKTNKLAPGAVTGSKIDDQSTPFSRVVHTATGDGEQALASSGTLYPLDGSTYTQKAGQINQFLGALDVRFEAGCTQPRGVTAFLAIDPVDPMAPSLNEVLAFGTLSDSGAGAASRHLDLGAYPGGPGALVPPGADQSHKLYLLAQGNCTAGAGVTATGAGIDVIGLS